MIQRDQGRASTVHLPDGRSLAYEEFGAPRGRPLFFFHGTPSSRLFRHPVGSTAAPAGIRLITVDRPGYGGSDPKPGRELQDWADDIQVLADHLRLSHFAIAGMSGGGPHALVCASRMPDRVTTVGLLGSVAPLDVRQFTEGMNSLNSGALALARRSPQALQHVLRPPSRWFRRHPRALVCLSRRLFSEADQVILSRPEVLSIVLADIPEGLANRGQGLVDDIMVLARPWPISMSSISVPVRLWHGTSDKNVPVLHGQRLADKLPYCNATFFPGEGHLLMFDHWLSVVTALVGMP